jgi:hypothetical protein
MFESSIVGDAAMFDVVIKYFRRVSRFLKMVKNRPRFTTYKTELAAICHTENLKHTRRQLFRAIQRLN